MFEKLLEELNTLRLRTARFRRVALHLHSPDSHDWAANTKEQQRNDRATLLAEGGENRFLAEMQPHYDLAAITDHMRSSYSTRVSHASSGNAQPIVLPGVEINFRLNELFEAARIHMLAIFPEGTTIEKISQIYSEQNHIPEDNKRTGQEDVRNLELKEMVRRIHKLGGLCIGAHIENAAGLRHRLRSTTKDVLQLVADSEGQPDERAVNLSENLRNYMFESGLDAIEITKPEHSAHYIWKSQDGTTKFIPCLLTTDAHSVEAFTQDRATHLKMTTLGIAGLRQAFSFPETRIRFPQGLVDSPDERVLGIQVTGNHDSFFENVTVAFAENLSCVIGVRGSGKSTLVEALRYAFGYNRTLNLVGDLEHPLREMQQQNLTGTVIRIPYRLRSGETRILQATYDPKTDYSTKVFDVKGNDCGVANVEQSGEYPLRLFGWSEIEKLGQSASNQRELLDLVVPALTPHLTKRQQIRSDMTINRAEIRKHVQELKTTLAAANGLIRRFREFQNDLATLNSPQVRSAFAELDNNKEKVKLVELLIQNAQSMQISLSTIRADTLFTGVDQMMQSVSTEVVDWFRSATLGALELPATQSTIQSQVAIIEKTLIDYLSRLQAEAALLGVRQQEIIGELKKQFEADTNAERIFELRANAEKRLQSAVALRRSYLDIWGKFDMAFSVRRQLGSELERVQSIITKTRQEHNSAVERELNRFLPADMRVAIDFKPSGDNHALGELVARPKMFGAKGHSAKRIRSAVESYMTPISFAEASVQSDFSTLIHRNVLVDGKEQQFSREDAMTCCDKMRLFDHDTDADVKLIREEALEYLLDVYETEWDDRAAILLNDAPVNERSPGQRSSALLPLIALAETTPLVIDQPEDNLDKRLIGSVLMNVLASLKEKRQIIVCTHDPNILVGGDAEQVIHLEADSDRKARVGNHGSIDNDDIVATVVDLLEGGAEAFAGRQRRYGVASRETIK